jgi:serine/threonine protein phosphatase PrpC
MRIERLRHRASPKDTVLLATDGLFDNLRTPRSSELLRTGPLDEGIAGLARAARRRMEAADERHSRQAGRPDLGGAPPD